jgi:hypothetical protein
LVKNP